MCGSLLSKLGMASPNRSMHDAFFSELQLKQNYDPDEQAEKVETIKDLRGGSRLFGRAMILFSGGQTIPASSRNQLLADELKACLKSSICDDMSRR